MDRLFAHPDFPYPPGTYVESGVNLSQNGVLHLRYGLSGIGTGVRLPRKAVSARKDDLWRHTCFEAFVRAGGDDYLEINLSPSTEWAVYAFDGYREGMRSPDLSPPRIETEQTADRFELRAEVDLGGLLLGKPPWRAGLTAVVEADRGLSYWALRHPQGKPDFHHPDCFALELPATEGA